jgi:uncharacterized phage protein (TIGR02216 family)
MGGFDWSGLLKIALTGLRLTPAQFWALTPVELSLMLGTENVRPPIDRASLEALARRFPDATKGSLDD